MVPHQHIDERAFKCVSQVQTPRHIWRRNDDTEWFSTLSRIDFVGLVSFPNLLPFGFGGFCVVLGGGDSLSWMLTDRFATIYDCAIVGMMMRISIEIIMFNMTFESIDRIKNRCK